MAYRLVRIEGLHNFVPDQHLDFILYNGVEYKTIPYQICQRDNGYCFLKHRDDTVKNFDIFTYLNIDNKECYCERFSKLHAGNFPEHSSLENLRTTILSFFELNKYITIPSKYKVGDKVIVGKRDGRMEDYPCCFADIMVNPGRVLTITKIVSNGQYARKYFEEPYRYSVKETPFNWSSSMFSGLAEEQTPSSNLQITSINDVASDRWKVHLSNGEAISLSVIGTEECKKTIIPEFYKFLKNPPKREITQVSQQKTQGNAYQFQRRKGTVRVGDVPEGNRICGKRSKASVSSRPLSYRKGVSY